MEPYCGICTAHFLLRFIYFFCKRTESSFFNAVHDMNSYVQLCIYDRPLHDSPLLIYCIAQLRRTEMACNCFLKYAVLDRNRVMSTILEQKVITCDIYKHFSNQADIIVRILVFNKNFLAND